MFVLELTLQKCLLNTLTYVILYFCLVKNQYWFYWKYLHNFNNCKKTKSEINLIRFDWFDNSGVKYKVHIDLYQISNFKNFFW